MEEQEKLHQTWYDNEARRRDALARDAAISHERELEVPEVQRVSLLAQVQERNAAVDAWEQEGRHLRAELYNSRDDLSAARDRLRLTSE